MAGDVHQPPDIHPDIHLGFFMRGHLRHTRTSKFQLRRVHPIALGGRAIQVARDLGLLCDIGPASDARVEWFVEQWSDGPYFFNFAQGVLPDTPVERGVTGS